MARTYKKKLDDEDVRNTFLEILRNTGLYNKACLGIGLAHTTVLGYRKKHLDFDTACQLAKHHGELMKTIKTNTLIREKALKKIEERIDNDTIKDSTLLRLLEGIEPR